MLNVTADQIKLANVPKFQGRLQTMIDSFEDIVTMDATDSVKQEKVAAILNGIGK